MLRIFQVYSKQLKGKRRVSTWSPLANAFNSVLSEAFELNYSRNATGLFGINDLQTADGFHQLKDQAIIDTNNLINEATSQSRNRKMVQIFDDLSDTLCRVADLAEFIRIAHPDKKFTELAEDACITISGLVEKLNTHRGLYNALRDVVVHGDFQKTSDIDDHVAKLFLFDFEQCGIHLQENLRQEVVAINDRILQVGQKFMAGAVAPRIVKADLLPDVIRSHFTQDQGHTVVNGLYPDSSNEHVREVAYKTFLYPDNHQESLLKDMLNSRHRLAELCGFPSYAHRAIRGSTVETPRLVGDFLNILNNELSSRVRSDFDIMRSMKKAEGDDRNELMPWDTTYFTSKVKRRWLGTSANAFAPYFSLGACMEGLNILTQALYGVKLEAEQVVPGEVWAPNVQKLAVICEKDGVLGHIYCDFYEREGKPNQDCHFTIQGGRLKADGSYQNPVVVVMLSLPITRWSNPSLLTPLAVDNLFHEMGHALHSMLGRTQYQHVTGTRCSADFAEVPSILMEYFASDPRVVKLFAKHYETQQPMPENMLEKLCTSKHVFPASELQIQVFYSMLDQIYHSKKIEGSTTEILKTIQTEYYGLPYVEQTAWQLRFSHLVGYGAKYYSYLISRAIASWIWQTYFRHDPLSSSAGDKYRRECLAHGGGKPSLKVVEDFLDKEASAENFATALITEIDSKNEHIQKVMELNI